MLHAPHVLLAHPLSRVVPHQRAGDSRRSGSCSASRRRRATPFAALTLSHAHTHALTSSTFTRNAHNTQRAHTQETQGGAAGSRGVTTAFVEIVFDNSDGEFFFII